MERPHLLEVIGSTITQMLTYPAITFIIAALLFGFFKLIRRRFTLPVFAITAISFVSALLNILTRQ